MKKVLLLLLFVSLVMASYGHEWHQIAEDIYAYQLKHKIFCKSKRRNQIVADKFHIAMNHMDLLQMCNAQTGDTLYIDEATTVENGDFISLGTNKKDYTYSISSNVQNGKFICLKVQIEEFESTYESEILERWNINKMQRLSKLYSKEVSDGGTSHYIRIVLQEDDKYDMQMFVTRGFYDEEEDDEKELDGLW